MKKIITAVASLMLTYTANAGIVASAPAITINAGTGQDIMVGTDVLKASFWSFGASGFQIDKFAPEHGEGLVLDATSRFLKPLNAGDIIDAGGSYRNDPTGTNGSAYYSESFGAPYTAIGDNQSVYFGFRIPKTGGFIHGWLKMTRISNQKLTIDSVAYESDLNVAIKAGQTAGGGTPTNIKNVQAGSYELFPNPVAGVLNLKMSQANLVKSVAVFDLNGRKFLEQNIIPAKEMQINTNFLKSGLYFIQVTDPQNRTEILKFIKQ